MRVIFKEKATEAQITWRSYDNPNDVLTVGDTYEVSSWNEFAWHTEVTLVGITGRFNSVHFEKVEDEQ